LRGDVGAEEVCKPEMTASQMYMILPFTSQDAKLASLSDEVEKH
jgi:hypothetical protein